MSKKKPDFSLLGDDQKRALKEKAAKVAQETALKELEEIYLAEETAKSLDAERTRLGKHEKEDMVTFLVNLAPNADHIRLNHDIYQHGHEYTRPRSTWDTIREIMFRGWVEERKRLGDKTNPFNIFGRETIKETHGAVGA